MKSTEIIKIVNFLACVILFVGSLGIIGWFFHIDILKSFLFDAPKMKFGVALSFVCTGVSLFLITKMRTGKITLGTLGLPITILS